MKAVIALLLVIVSWPASAQTVTQGENLQRLLFKLRACVRANAPAAQAAVAENPIRVLIDTCEAQSIFLGVGSASRTGPGKLSLDDYVDVGPIPPGILRRAVEEEWAAFVDETRAR